MQASLPVHSNVTSTPSSSSSSRGPMSGRATARTSAATDLAPSRRSEMEEYEERGVMIPSLGVLVPEVEAVANELEEAEEWRGKGTT